MTLDRMVELLEIEHECMLRGSHDDCDRKCEDCELVQDDYDLHEMYTDVIAIVKDQKAHVITLEEAMSAEDPVFFESDGNACFWCDVCVSAFPKAAMIERYGADSFHLLIRDYGKTWRCWNRRPSEDQRKEVPWT